MISKIKNWIKGRFKDRFTLYSIEDLTIGGHCGCCGNWIEDVIVPKDWAISICSKCLKI